MSRQRKNLERAFGIQLSEPKWKTALRGGKETVKEKAIGKVERKVHPSTLAAIEKAEERAAAALAAKSEKEEKARAAKVEKDRKSRELAAQRTACTCRRPQLDKNGKCRRCKKFPGVKKRGLFG
jgi:hypothetical protein